LAQLLSENKNKNLTEREMEFARNICNSGNDLLSLINEILDLSKVEAGKIELEIEEIEISAINESVFSMFSEIAKSKSINFNIDYKENTLPHGIVSDRQRVEQIIRNLLSNAFKFTDKKGNVTLTISGDYNAQPFRHFLLSQGSVIAFSVKDDGIGIPKEKLDVIFEAFQQVDGSTKRKYGGTGLGLSISRDLAHALGGEIQVESVEGKGSTFTLFLPFIYQGTNVSVARAAISSIQHKASIFPRITEQENSNSGDRSSINR
jgi:signal transduction histidine kinase